MQPLSAKQLAAILGAGVGAAAEHRQQLAGRIEAYLSEHPGRPVYVIGMSAGTGVVVWALEDCFRSAWTTEAGSPLVAWVLLVPSSCCRTRLERLWLPGVVVVMLMATSLGNFCKCSGINAKKRPWRSPEGELKFEFTH